VLGLAGIGRLYTPHISAQAVHKWTRSGVVPAERVLPLSRATGISPSDFRPDIYPPDVFKVTLNP
jgi:DNA-binding transcriptional regulator YdaS (Cro superfamily)